MMKNSKGLSTLVVTVILLALVLVAIGIVWGVYRGLISSSSEKVELSAKCLGVDVRVKAISCPTIPGAETCTVTLERTGTSSDAITGVKMVFRSDTVNSQLLDGGDDVDLLGNIEPLVGKTITLASTVDGPNEVDVVPYFTDEAGNDLNCQNPTTFNF